MTATGPRSICKRHSRLQGCGGSIATAALALGLAARPGSASAQPSDVDVRAQGADADGAATVNTVGLGEAALPGLFSLGIPGLRMAGQWSVAGSSGYGFTSGHAGQTGGHHRLAGNVALAFTPLAGLDLSLRLAGRRESHPADAQGGDDSYTGAPGLAARYGQALGGWMFGAEAALNVPGREAPSLDFSAAVVDLKLQGGRRRGALMLVGLAGFRYDRSGNAKPDLARTRPGDRLALGLSDYNAALVGLGLGYRVRHATELIAEASADILLGGPSFTRSPMRGTLGARQTVGAHWQLFAMVTASPTRRGPETANDPLVPHEPRFGVALGAVYAWGRSSGPRADAPADYAPPSPPPAPAPPAAEPLPEPEPAVAEEPPAPSGQLRGLIRSFKGRGVRARVRVEPLGSETMADEEGAFVLDVAPGAYEVVIESEGFEPQRRQVRVEENGVTILNADLRLHRGRP